MLDSFGRNIRYLRISVTDRCNLRCVYCMPAEGVANIPHERILSYEQIARIAAEAVKAGFDKFRITGGEPLVRKDLPHLVSMLRELSGHAHIGMTTNGTLLAPLAHDLKSRGLDSVNISLDTLKPDRYRELTRGGILQDALEGIRAAQMAGFKLKINVVMTDKRSDEELMEIRRFAGTAGAEVQTIARYRFDEPKMDGGEFDRPPPCAFCDRIRLLADGTLRPCLHSSTGTPVDFANIAGSLAAAVKEKPECGLSCKEAAVSSIGG